MLRVLRDGGYVDLELENLVDAAEVAERVL
jgi:hypothetical protein